MKTTIADKLKLIWLYIRFKGGCFSRVFMIGPIKRVRLAGPAAAELLLAPQDLSTADPTLATDIYEGYFSLGGHTVKCGGTSPFEMRGTPVAWQCTLHEFGWLKHMRAAETSVARVQARAFVEDWIRIHGGLSGIGGTSQRTAKRVIAWLCHSPLLLHECDHAFYRRFMRSLSRQVRFLRLVADNAPAGMSRLYVAIALGYAAICMSGHQKFATKAIKRLDRELERQILADGGHISRNPADIITILSLLLPFRQAIIARDIVPSETMTGAIDRLMPMIRFFRLGDGALAKFNGMGDTPNDVLATMLAHDDAKGAPVLNAQHSGYQRLFGDDVIVLMDTGSVPAQAVSGSVHAGCLSFEMSAGSERIVMNCGHLDSGTEGADADALARISRSTAAHSTLTIDERSSCVFLPPDMISGLEGMPVLSGPKHVDVKRNRDEYYMLVDASHDGYAKPFKLRHNRKLALSHNGRILTGQDQLQTIRNRPVSTDSSQRFQIRFHLHTRIMARCSSANTVEITTASGKNWLFTCNNTPVGLEETVDLSETYGVKPALQIVLEGALKDISLIDWNFRRLS